MAGKRPIRVLELRSVRGTGGGPEKTIMFGAKLAAPDIKVTVCYIRDTRDEVYKLDQRAGKLDIDYVEVREDSSFDRKIWPQLKQLIADRQIDIVHAHEYKTDLIALLLKRRTGIIPLSTVHGWTGHGAKERYVYYPFDKWVLARYPKLIAVSTDIKNQLVKFGAHPDRIEVILNTIDPGAFRRAPELRAVTRAELGLRDDEIVLGTVGRVERQKRFDILLDVFAKLRAAKPLRLVIVGDGSLMAPLKAQAAALNLGDRCIFTGQREDIARVHHAFDIFVQSSEYEGTPNAVLEAMAMESPLVATDAGGTRELAFDNVHALIVPIRNPDALQSAVERMLADPEAARARAVAARGRIESDLSFPMRTKKLEAIYRELADGRR